jgi:radical SAM superfamily enzyme YgiQ (UPF0313 family)
MLVRMPAHPRVLLVHPGALYGGRWAVPFVVKPALMSLFSHLRAAGVEVDVVDLQVELGNPGPDGVEEYLRRADELVAARRPELLAISCWSSLEYLGAVEVARRAKARDPEVRIVVGGYHPTAVPEDFTGPDMPFDLVVRGEGEVALLEAVTAGLQPGGGCTVIDGSPLPLDRPALDFAAYPYVKDRPGELAVYLSRGCPYTCAFCMEGVKGHAWRPYPVAIAIDVVARAMALRPHVLFIQDACFAHRASWRREFLQGLLDLDLHLPIWVEMRADRIDGDDLELLQRLDVFLQLGVETMSPVMATRMNKAKDGARYVAAVDATLREIVTRGMPSKAFLIFHHPGETPDTAEETIGYFERLVDEAPKSGLIVGGQPYAYFPGSHVAEHLEEYERLYGTRVAHPAWWRGPGAHHELAIDVVPSREIPDPRAWVPLAARVKEIKRRTLAKMPAAAQLLLFRYFERL